MMMKLDRDLTRIVVEEVVAENLGLTQELADQASITFTATLDGNVGWTEVRMSRNGKTPDEAIKHLFEAMGDAGVEL